MGAPDLASLFQSMPMAVIVIRPDRTIESANSATESLVQKSVRKMLGVPVLEVVRFDDPRIRRGLNESDSNLTARSTMLLLDGIGQKSVDMMLTPIGSNDGWQLLIIIESGSGQNMLSGDAASDGFAIKGPDILAHEIKNPLAAIKGAAQLLERKLDDPNKRLTGLITGEVDRIALLIDQMQSLTRQTSLPLAPCNIYEPISRACDILEAAHPGQVKIVEEFDPSIPPVMASNENLVQVILNLMTNALEASGQTKKPVIKLTTRFVSGIALRLSRDDASKIVGLPVEIRVSDNGPGIAPEIVQDVFAPFVTTKPNSQGLGLALVRKLVREMNGRIVHDRDRQNGFTNFRIFLPLAKQVKTS